MDDHQLAQRFEAHRDHLRAVAYRMLGSLSQADDAVQETWLRLIRHDPQQIENVGGWLTTVLGRVCLDMLRGRKARREDPIGLELPDSALNGQAWEESPEDEVMMADSVGLALLVVLDRLPAAERLAFVLHELFSVPFDEIGPVVQRSPVAAKKLASRARQRVRGEPTIAIDAIVPHRKIANRFIAACRRGDLEGVLEVLAPDVVRRGDALAVPPGGASCLRGAEAVAKETLTNSERARFAEVALVNGRVGVIVAPAGKIRFALILGIERAQIVDVEAIGTPLRLQRLELALLE